MRIDQFVHTLNYGDAISNEAITLKRIFREMGIESDIYAIHAHEKVKEQVLFWNETREIATTADGKRAVILHYSIASPLNNAFKKLTGIKKICLYHNLTPTKWFLAYNDRVVKDLETGREELPHLIKSSDLLLADSDYNKSELIGFGADDVRVVNLPLDSEKWAIAANSGIGASLKAHGGKNLLHVGRLAPNKCVEDIIKAFYFYHHKIEKKSKLWLIGIDIDTEIYSFELRRLVTELRLDGDVHFVGAVADCELKAFYQNSDVYLCMSEHEGFCVPLVEAMSFGLPVIAFDACAVKDTLGDGGLLLARKSPAEVAELINIVLTDKELRQELISRGQHQAQTFSLDNFRTTVKKEIIEAF